MEAFILRLEIFLKELKQKIDSRCLSSMLPGMDWLFDLGLFLILSLCVVGTVVGVSRFRYRWWLCLLLFLLYLPYAWISNFAWISTVAPPEEGIGFSPTAMIGSAPILRGVVFRGSFGVHFSRCLRCLPCSWRCGCGETFDSLDKVKAVIGFVGRRRVGECRSSFCR